MANTKQQRKRVKTASREHMENLRYKSRIKTMFKSLTVAAQEDKERAAGLALELITLIDKAASRGVIHTNNAARKKSQVAGLVDLAPGTGKTPGPATLEPKSGKSKADRRSERHTVKTEKAKAVKAKQAAKAEAEAKAAKAKPKAKKEKAAEAAVEEVAEPVAEEAPVEEAVVPAEEAPTVEAEVTAEEAPVEETPSEEEKTDEPAAEVEATREEKPPAKAEAEAKEKPKTKKAPAKKKEAE